MKTRQLVECAVMIAASTVLSFVKLPSFWAFGGGVTVCSMLPLVIVSCRYGTRTGLWTAFAHSALQLLFGLDNIQYAVNAWMAVGIILLDYTIAYTVIGFSGVFYRDRNDKPRNAQLCAGIFMTFFARFICHFVSGWWIWEALWPNELSWAAPVWSLAYNASYMLPEIVLTAIAACLLNRATSLLVCRGGKRS